MIYLEYLIVYLYNEIKKKPDTGFKLIAYITH